MISRGQMDFREMNAEGNPKGVLKDTGLSENWISCYQPHMKYLPSNLQVVLKICRTFCGKSSILTFPASIIDLSLDLIKANLNGLNFGFKMRHLISSSVP